MESIAALGLACNIFQIISFGNETIRLVRDVYSRGFLETPLAEHAVTLRDVASHIIAFETPVNPRKYEVQLKDNATKCHAVARDLVEEIKFLLSERAKGDLAGTLKVVSKVAWRKRRLERLEKQLCAVEKQMQTGLLVRVCDRIDAIGAKQRTLNEDVHRLIQQYGSGETQASKLISEYSNLTRDQISLKAVELQCQINNDIGQSQNDIIVNIEKAVESFSTQTVSHMTKLEFSREKAEQKALFINSLTFSGMNERRNQVSEGHEGTSQWIFYRSEPDLEGSWKGLYGEAKNQGIGEKDSVRPWDNFSDWLQSNEQIYWISGKPGSGKTTMAKYILSHPMTKRLLDSWKPDFMMVSHFFWRPGSTLQQNIKGMVASILYQLLRNSQLSTDLAMCNVHDITEKRPDGVCGNWSLAELKQTTATVLEQHERPVFVLIDGVDEVTPSDGVSDLLLMIEDLYKRPNAKLCILSRPVAWVQRSLAGYPSLRISDFTAGDISRYTHDKLVKSFEDLQGHSPSLSFAQVKLLIRQLVNKAEGSFLWLHLSLNSVVRGIQQGDEFNSLQARIFSLPETISDQYKEMWKRTSEDTTVYQRRAALVFKLIIFGRTLAVQSWPATVLTMTLVTTPWGQRILDGGPDIASVNVLIKACKATEHEVVRSCAGLTEMITLPTPPVDNSATGQVSKTEDCVLNQEYQLQLYQSYKAFRLIHRSAYDFLTDTVEGHRILDREPAPIIEILVRLVSGLLAAHRIKNLLKPRNGARYPGIHYQSRYPHLLSHSTTEWFLERISSILTAHVSTAGLVLLPPNAKALIRKCAELSASGELKSQYSTCVSGACNRQEFLSQAAFYLGFRNTHQVYGTSTKPEEITSMFFARCQRCLQVLKGHKFDFIMSNDSVRAAEKEIVILFLELTELLEEHDTIDINRKGKCRFNDTKYCLQYFVTTTPLVVLLSSVVSLLSQFSRSAANRSNQSISTPSDRLFESCLKALAVFAQRGASLSEKVFFYMRIHDDYWILRPLACFFSTNKDQGTYWRGITVYFRADVLVKGVVRAALAKNPRLASSANVQALQRWINAIDLPPAECDTRGVLTLHSSSWRYLPARNDEVEMECVVPVSHATSSVLIHTFCQLPWIIHQGAGDVCEDLESKFQDIWDREIQMKPQNCPSADLLNCLLRKAGTIGGHFQDNQSCALQAHWKSILISVGAMEEVQFTDGNGHIYSMEGLQAAQTE